ncbi:MAG TPA: TMEM175 family protein [Solirubrobacteraceae bacterium]|nr:TMEM175 family protein [Solirubrobacteraceae bacterium]
MSTGRLESFSDGVFAVAATLLVLNITFPSNSANLGHALLKQWPIYAAYVTSFITIGIIWMNHHAMLSRLARADHSIVMLNVLLLLTIGVIPFGTSLMASYLRSGRGDHLAAGIYGGIFLVMSIAFSLVNRQILIKRPQLMKEELSLEHRRKLLLRGIAGLGPYVLAVALAPLSPYATLVIAAALAAFYALPVATDLEPGG